MRQDFFARDADSVARALLGAILVYRRPDGERRLRVVESEAYVGTHDLACHAAKGRTPRTEVIFGPAGRAYVYRVYGMHILFNVVAGRDGEAQAVLIRAGEPMQACSGPTNGPGRLTRALGIERRLNGLDLTGEVLFFAAGDPPRRVVRTSRIGVEYAGPWRDAPLRFYDADSTWVSRR